MSAERAGAFEKFIASLFGTVRKVNDVREAPGMTLNARFVG